VRSRPPHPWAAALAASAGLGFGIPGLCGLRFFAQTGDVWTFGGFPTYGEGPFEGVGIETSLPLLAGFLAVCTAEVWLALGLWRDWPRSTTLSHGLLPVEVAFWTGFALPFGFVFGMGRTVLVLAARKSSGPRSAPDLPARSSPLLGSGGEPVNATAPDLAA
jgi:hypothetical protein